MGLKGNKPGPREANDGSETSVKGVSAAKGEQMGDLEVLTH